jgi:signal peptidase I
MRRFYTRLGYHLDYYPWGRSITLHVRAHPGLYGNLEALFTALLLALLIKRFLFEAYKIPSGSMRDTLQVEDRIFVGKFIYEIKDIELGDIIVFKTPEEIYDPEKPYYIKRVVGLPGDLIEIRNGAIIRNGRLLDSPGFFVQNEYYSRLRNRAPFRRTRVPEDEVFVFGDNSKDSFDSRYWGGVPIANVLGRAVFRYWPPGRIGLIADVPVGDSRHVAEEQGTQQREAYAAGQD